MKTLTFSNGATIECVDTSTEDSIVCVVSKYAEIDAIKENFTTENLDGATLGETTLTNKIAKTITTTADGNILVTLTLSAKSQVELLEEQVRTLSEALAELATSTKGE